MDGMNKCLSNLDSRADKQRFLEANHTAFMIPKKFDTANYQHKIDEVNFSSRSFSFDFLSYLLVKCGHILVLNDF